VRIEAGDSGAIVALVRAELALLGEGRCAVIVPEGLLDNVASALVDGLGSGVVAAGNRALDAAVSVVTVRQAKGLEFDTVVLVEPAQILAASARGANDVYVALTRPTQRLYVAHSEPLPPGLETLSSTVMV